MRGVISAQLIVFLLLLPLVANADLVNINTADLTTLQTLNGIGPSKGQAIIDYRTQHGPFAKIEDIMNVSGIGTATYNNIKDYITVADTSSQSSSSQAQTQSSPSSAAQTSVSTASSNSSYVAPPVPSLYVDAGADRTVIVGADTEFNARAYNSSSELVGNTRFSWNFGDGTIAEGQSVLHHYSYPGRYALFVSVAQDKSAGTDEVVVTAEPAKLAFKVLPDGGAEIDNLAERDLDLSGWIVHAGDGSLQPLFVLPPHSTVLSGSAIRIPRSTLGFAATSQTVLEYPNGVAALRAGETAASVQRGQTVQTAPPPAAPARVVQSIPDGESEADPPPDSDAASSTEFVASAAASTGGTSFWWWIAAAALAAAAAASLIAARRAGAKEWDIIEEGGE